MTARAVHVDVELGGWPGRRPDDRRLARPDRQPANVDVAVTADVPEFMRRFIERVGGLAEGRSDVAL